MSSGPEELLGLSGNEVLYRLNICIPTSANADLYTSRIYTLEIQLCTCRRRANVPSLQGDQSYSVALQKSGRVNTECLNTTESYTFKAP